MPQQESSTTPAKTPTIKVTTHVTKKQVQSTKPGTTSIHQSLTTTLPTVPILKVTIKTSMTSPKEQTINHPPTVVLRDTKDKLSTTEKPNPTIDINSEKYRKKTRLPPITYFVNLQPRVNKYDVNSKRLKNEGSNTTKDEKFVKKDLYKRLDFRRSPSLKLVISRELLVITLLLYLFHYRCHF